MSLESGNYISDLVVTNPTGTDPKSQGDDHIRLLKSTIKTTFPNISGAVTPTHTELNYVDGVTSAIQTQLDAITTLADGKIYIGNGSNVATERTLSGDVTVDNTGVTAISSGVIVNADISASAAIALSKMGTGTASKYMGYDGSGNPAEVAAPIFTEATAVADQSIATLTNTSYSFTHGLTTTPKLVEVRMKCTHASGDVGYSQNEVILAPITASSSGNQGLSVRITATTVVVSTGASGFLIQHGTTGASTSITAGRWSFQVKAYA